MAAFTKPLIILASASPRRRTLLKEAGYRFKVVPSEVSERAPGPMLPHQLVQYLALKKALAVALESGKLAGAALDVFEAEPPKDLTVLKPSTMIATPHLGASTEEAQVAVAVEVAQSILDYLSGKGTKNAVNIPMMDPEMLERTKPYLHLAEKIGILTGQPDFQIIGLARGEAHVSSAQQHLAVGQIKRF